MTLLPRRFRPGLLLAALAIAIALPVTWTDQAPWTGPAPALSYAGGSPDETLGPSPTNQQGGSTTTTPPTRRSQPVVTRSLTTTQSPTTAERFTRGVTARDFARANCLLVWKFSLASVLRF
jgi:hypothetical protein